MPKMTKEKADWYLGLLPDRERDGWVICQLLEDLDVEITEVESPQEAAVAQ